MTQPKQYIPPEHRALLSAEELGEYLGVSENYARRLIDEAPFDTIPVGRSYKVYRRSVDAWLEQQAERSREERTEREAMAARVLSRGTTIASSRKRSTG